MKTSKPRVLLIEDELISQSSEKALLEDYGFIVDVASSATEGLDLLHERSFSPFEQGYSAIFVDILLPDINGDVLTEVMRQTEEHVKSIPIIAVTGRELSSADRELFARVGITDIIIKPMTKEVLNPILKKYKIAKVSDTSCGGV
ncbi:MAG: response regulator [Gammaproteobacteria bacterium]